MIVEIVPALRVLEVLTALFSRIAKETISLQVKERKTMSAIIVQELAFPAQL